MRCLKGGKTLRNFLIGAYGNEIQRYDPHLEIFEGRLLSKILLDRYSRNPQGWSFTVSPPVRQNSFFDAIVANREEVWRLKLDSIFKQNPLMIGAKVDTDSPKIIPSNSFVPYGYRKLNPELLFHILKLAGDGHLQANRLEELDHFESLLAATDTVAPKDGESYAEGPFVYSNRPVLAPDSQQKLLDEKLSTEMRKMLRNRFPLYG
jgi:hypothetical protein